VDLGTAGNKKAEKAVARKEEHRGDKTEIDAMKLKYEAAVKKHAIAVATSRRHEGWQHPLAHARNDSCGQYGEPWL
jgi:hypothetical protein